MGINRGTTLSTLPIAYYILYPIVSAIYRWLGPSGTCPKVKGNASMDIGR